jgi:SAM-dependent methyltransferase
MTNTLPIVTIGVLSWNRLHYLRATLESAHRCINYPNIQWIVLDNYSTEPGLAEYLKSLQWVDELLFVNSSHVSAMNEIISRAKGDVVLLWPDDMQFVLEGDWMKDCVELLMTNHWIGSMSLNFQRRQTIQRVWGKRRFNRIGIKETKLDTMPLITPSRRDYWKTEGYVTYRRLWLDTILKAFSHEMRGTVVDVAGKRENKRGAFQPPESQAAKWLYLNLDLSTEPNVYGDVQQMPLKSQSVDCAICTEVLEHLPRPEQCVNEIHRILCDGGQVLASLPFLYPVHADPFDYQRFTEDGLRNLFKDFKTVDVYRMGGYAGSLGLILELGIRGTDNRVARWVMKWVSRWLCRQDLLNFGHESEAWSKFTTGYFVRAVR